MEPGAAGADGGLKTGAYQPQADPAFDAAGNATVKSIAKGVKFFAVDFGVSTNEKDPASAPRPRSRPSPLTARS